jgi:hypothetical protein
MVADHEKTLANKDTNFGQWSMDEALTYIEEGDLIWLILCRM